jgi:hypothetical protein
MKTFNTGNLKKLNKLVNDYVEMSLTEGITIKTISRSIKESWMLLDYECDYVMYWIKKCVKEKRYLK